MCREWSNGFLLPFLLISKEYAAIFQKSFALVSLQVPLPQYFRRSSLLFSSSQEPLGVCTHGSRAHPQKRCSPGPRVRKMESRACMQKRDELCNKDARERNQSGQPELLAAPAPYE